MLCTTPACFSTFLTYYSPYRCTLVKILVYLFVQEIIMTIKIQGREHNLIITGEPTHTHIYIYTLHQNNGITHPSL